MYPLFLEVAHLVVVVQERTVFVCMRIFDISTSDATFVFAFGNACIMIMARLVTVCTNRNHSNIVWISECDIVDFGRILPGVLVRPVLWLGRLVRRRATGRM